ncbi:MAG TPA: sigma-70 family RNA polymerase sigma factor [Bacteroidota bacterium]|nr:sigma-70 family RNA polymerase sigma factor [Bacteroidota bacterium]
MPSRTDLELVEAFRNGDLTGFNELVRRHQERVYWIARRVMGKHDDAADVVQDVFVRMFKALKGFRGDSEFSTWLYRIAMNVSLNAVRAKRVKDFIRYDDTIESRSEELPDAELLRNEYQTVLERAIQRLPPKQKLVFIMRYYDEMPYEQMAKVLKKSVGGLKANYFHALKKVQQYVRKEMG